MNNIINSNAVNADIFTKYINSETAAEIASDKLREAIVYVIINNTSTKTLVDEGFYDILIQEAKKFITTKTIKVYKDDEYLKTYSFVGNNQQILITLQKFFADVVLFYGCYFEDSISYGDKKGFCWKEPFTGNKIAIVQ